METEAGFSSVAPPVLDGDNYQTWVVRMETYLEALDLREAVEEDYDIPLLPDNPTIDKTRPGYPPRIPRVVPPSEVPTVQPLGNVQWNLNFKKESKHLH